MRCDFNSFPSKVNCNCFRDWLSRGSLSSVADWMVGRKDARDPRNNNCFVFSKTMISIYIYISEWSTRQSVYWPYISDILDDLKTPLATCLSPMCILNCGHISASYGYFLLFISNIFLHINIYTHTTYLLVNICLHKKRKKSIKTRRRKGETRKPSKGSE